MGITSRRMKEPRSYLQRGGDYSCLYYHQQLNAWSIKYNSHAAPKADIYA